MDSKTLEVHAIKVGDLGVAASLDNPFVSMQMQRRCGSLNFIAPEVLKSENYSEVQSKSNKRVDSFGIAIVTYILFYGRHPFQIMDDAEMKSKVDQTRQITADWAFPDTPSISE